MRHNKSAEILRLYDSRRSIPQVSRIVGLPLSTVRYTLKAAGVLRGRAEGIVLAADQGRLGSGMRGKTRVFTPEHKATMSRAAIRRWANTAKGTRIKPSGYVEFTRGENKGRGVHAVVMEKSVGRRLRPDECVHHIDGDRQNNGLENLELMTRASHSRLHRLEEIEAGLERERDHQGRYV